MLCSFICIRICFARLTGIHKQPLRQNFIMPYVERSIIFSNGAQHLGKAALSNKLNKNIFIRYKCRKFFLAKQLHKPRGSAFLLLSEQNARMMWEYKTVLGVLVHVLFFEGVFPIPLYRGNCILHFCKSHYITPCYKSLHVEFNIYVVFLFHQVICSMKEVLFIFHSYSSCLTYNESSKNADEKTECRSWPDKSECEIDYCLLILSSLLCLPTFHN